MPSPSEFRTARQRMVTRQLESRGITDPRVLQAMRNVPREIFVPEHLAADAYDDSPLPILGGQTISQPYIVALMVESLKLNGGERVLEVGTGSGYGAAVLSRIADVVVTIERLERLAEQARTRFAELGYGNIDVRVGDGTLGVPELAPYDGIVVTASGPHVPSSLKEQLAVGGRLVMPVAEAGGREMLVRITRLDQERFEQEELTAVRFVPLIGVQGWGEEGASG